MENKKKIICLTPVKNESWILDTFLKCASVWADHIIIADQMSTDGSRQIAIKYDKVILIDNDAKEFNEPERQKLLLTEARKIDGENIFIALDADEILAGDFKSEEWLNLKNQGNGTVLLINLLNVKPDKLKFWKAQGEIPFGFIDDGSVHTGRKIHSVRIPFPENAPQKKMSSLKVMHLQYIDWKRMQSKHRWYQCYETLQFPEKSPVDIFRMYHHMYSRVISGKLDKVLPDEFSVYTESNINPFGFKSSNYYYWDYEVLDLIVKHGLKKFEYLNIWNVDWEKVAHKNENYSVINFKKKVSLFSKLIINYLKATQVFYPNFLLKITDKILKKCFHRIMRNAN